MNTRHRFLVALCAALLIAPLGALAQRPGKVWRVGVLVTARRPAALDSDAFGALPRGLRELGYIEGENLVIEWRFADGKFERLPELATELVQLRVDVIVAHGTPGTLAAQKATRTIPIVFPAAGDPVANGLVKSLARPGGNTTGISLLAGERVESKQMEMLHGMVPRLSRIAVLLNPATAYSPVALKGLRTTAATAGLELQPVEAQTEEGLENAFRVMVAQRAGALLIVRDGFFNQQVRQIAALALKDRLPTMGGLREYAEAGGLMSYGQNSADNWHRAAAYVDKILKGANPGELPVEQPTTLELVINRKTAKALGLEIPAELLVLADKVID